jgi:phosphoribosylglycinamide formyltransferase-1
MNPVEKRARKRLGILLSGRGSNFLAIAEAISGGRLDAQIAVVISNRPEAPGIAAAIERGMNAMAFPSKGLDREVYDRALIGELRRHAVDLVCLAGYMRILSGHFIREYSMRILNIHPSLLPAFPGLDAQHHRDTAESLSERILKEEHRIYAEGSALVLSGKYHFEGRRVVAE